MKKLLALLVAMTLLSPLAYAGGAKPKGHKPGTLGYCQDQARLKAEAAGHIYPFGTKAAQIPEEERAGLVDPWHVATQVDMNKCNCQFVGRPWTYGPDKEIKC